MIRSDNRSDIASSRYREQTLAIKKLGPKNIGDVIGLFHLVNELAPHGHLADRTREELAYVLTNQNSMSVGAYHGENLVAYSISRLASNPYRDSQFMAFVEQSGSPFYVGMGTVVHPQHRGQRLGFRLTKLRWRFLRRRGPCHLTGLVALNNRSSIASLLHAGAILVGLARDATAQNYIVYQGLLQQRLYLREHRVYIDLGDEVSAAELFSRQHVGLGLRQTHDSFKHQLVLASYEIQASA